MMKLERYILLVAMLLGCIATRGDDFNPDSPPEPNAYYKLTLAVDPVESGWHNTMATEGYAAGEQAYVYASANTNFTFLQWVDDEGEVVSTSSAFYYTMPARNVKLTAQFKFAPDNPYEPDEPSISGKHYLTYAVSPVGAGYISGDSEGRYETGSERYLYAHVYDGFTFRSWSLNGESVSTSNAFRFEMPDEDAYVVAHYDFTPDSPYEPEEPDYQGYSRIYVSSNLPDACSFNIQSGDKFYVGNTQRISCSPNYGFAFKYWLVNGEIAGYSTTLSYVVPKESSYVVAVFDFNPDNPYEPEEPEDLAGVYGLTDYVAIKERHMYPIYLNNTLHQAKGMVIDVQFPDGFVVDTNGIQPTKLTDTHTIDTEDLGDNNFRITTLGTENTLEKANGIALYIPVTIPVTAEVDSTYFVRLKYGVLTNMDDSQTPLLTHNGGLHIMEEGYCRITTSTSPYGYIEGGGKYKIGDTVTLTAIPYARYRFVSWTDDTTENPYVFEATGSLVIGANFELKPEGEYCQQPTIEYNGRWITLLSSDGSDLRYTLDGSEPNENSALYSEPVDAGGIVLVRAIATAVDKDMSEEAQYRTPAYFDGSMVTLDEAGKISLAFDWTDCDLYNRLSVAGPVSLSDLAYLGTMGALEHLDLEKAEISTFPAGPFVGSRLLSIAMPQSLTATANGIFNGVDRLAAIVWTSDANLSTSAMSGFNNPNTLIYVGATAQAPAGFANIIVDSHANKIELTDSENGNFYCPRAFTAAEISYSHDYSLPTPLEGLTEGWEAISLPFDVESITHATAGRIEPFAAGVDYAQAKPFWLDRLGSYGFEPADRILANVPYVISMPNNAAYYDEYILAGRVTFSASNATVPVTEPVTDQMGEYSFVSTMVDVSDSVAVLNREAFGAYKAGEVFVVGERGASPFEAYLTNSSSLTRAPIRIADMMADPSGLSDAMLLPRQLEVSVINGNTLRIQASVSVDLAIYQPTGMLVRTIKAHQGTTLVTDLAPGIYLIAGTKVAITR